MTNVEDLSLIAHKNIHETHYELDHETEASFCGPAARSGKIVATTRSMRMTTRWALHAWDDNRSVAAEMVVERE